MPPSVHCGNQGWNRLVLMQQACGAVHGRNVFQDWDLECFPLQFMAAVGQVSPPIFSQPCPEDGFFSLSHPSPCLEPSPGGCW